MSDAEIEIALPDGARLRVPSGSTVLDVAAQIGPGLAKAALAGKLDGRWVDLRAPLEQGGALQIVTARDAEGEDVIRHSAEHVMADAVKRLWPEARIDVGRSDHSEKFQYDLDLPVRLGPADLERIEAEMARIVAEDLPFEREVLSRDEARTFFEQRGETLKVSRIEDIPEGDDITVYRHGDFADLCRGPHVQRTGQIGAFKLTDLAGSYWRGDESNPMLQRVYGVAFKDRKALKAWAQRLELARERDHRKLGAELELFQFHEWSPGSPFYLPRGLRLYNALVEYIRDLYAKYGYVEVMCPQVFSAELFKTSGHYDNFSDDMFKMVGPEGEEDFLKPMNCPGHCLLFRSTKRSYRELPLRVAEFSRLHRNERSGTLHGLSRVRSMAQDDAHIFCEPQDLEHEVDRCMDMVREVYRDFGLEGVEIQLATRPDKFMGEIADWDAGEKMLRESVERAGLPCGLNPGEGAFYGPKLEFHFRDALNRAWQLSTIQLDVGMPGRFELRYIGRDGAEHQPAMLHRAMFGSLERFLGIYLEHTGGDLPVWLAPLPAIVLPIADRHADYGRKVVAALRAAGVYTELDDRSETLNYRVRSAENQKVPYILVVGDREQNDSTVTVRRRHHKGQMARGVDELARSIGEEIATRGIS